MQSFRFKPSAASDDKWKWKRQRYTVSSHFNTRRPNEFRYTSPKQKKEQKNGCPDMKLSTTGKPSLVRQFGEEASTVANQITDCNKLLSRKKSEIKSLRSDIAEKETALTESDYAKCHLEKECARLSTDLLNKEKQLSTLTAPKLVESSKFISEVVCLRKDNSAKDLEIQSLNSTIVEKEKALNESECAKSQTERDYARANIELLVIKNNQLTECERNRKEMFRFINEVQEFRKHISSNESVIQSLNNTIAEKEKELSQSEFAKSQLDKDYASVSRELQEIKDQLSTEIERNRIESSKFVNHVEDFNKTIAMKDLKIQELTDGVTDRDTQVQQLTADVKDKDETLAKRKDRIKTLRQRNEDALDDITDYKYDIKKLRKRVEKLTPKLECATVLPLHCYEESSTNELVHEVLKKLRKDRMQVQLLIKPHQTIVAADGLVFVPCVAAFGSESAVNDLVAAVQLDSRVAAVLVVFHPVAPHNLNPSRLISHELFKDKPFVAVLDAVFWQGTIREYFNM